MVIILALLAVALILLAEAWRRQRAGQRESGLEAAAVKTPASSRSAERYFHPGHSWAQIHRPQLASVGVDDFAARFIGKVESVEVRKPGTLVRQGEPLVTLRRGKRSLILVAPLSGILMDVNSRLSSEPALVNDSPYDKGWIAKLSPARLSLDLIGLLQGAAVQRWKEGVQEQLSRWFAPKLGTVLQDGGQWTDAVGELLNDEDWEKLVKILFPHQSSSKLSNHKPVTE